MCKAKETNFVETSCYKTAKNGQLMHFCTCAECGIKKTKFVKQKGDGIFDAVGKGFFIKRLFLFSKADS